MILRKLLASTSVFLTGVMVLTTVAFAGTFVVTNDSVNVRKAASSEASVLGQVNANDKVEVIDSADGWKKIHYGDVDGWISEQFLKSSDGASRGSSSNSSSGKTVYVNADDLNMRGGPGKGFDIIVTLDRGTRLTLVTTDGDWSKVKTQRGTTGWIMTKFVGSSSKSQSVSSKKASRGSDSEGSDPRSNIVSYAKRFLGTSYVYGGSSPNGFDCSGFLKYVFDNYGVYLDRVAAGQAGNGYWVSKGNLRSGDVVFFDTNGGSNYINHAGIYIGHGYFIHASSGGHEVMISNLNEGFYEGAYMTGRCVLGD